jgi:hypothetical protein
MFSIFFCNASYNTSCQDIYGIPVTLISSKPSCNRIENQLQLKTKCNRRFIWQIERKKFERELIFLQFNKENKNFLFFSIFGSFEHKSLLEFYDILMFVHLGLIG